MLDFTIQAHPANVALSDVPTVDHSSIAQHAQMDTTNISAGAETLAPRARTLTRAGNALLAIKTVRLALRTQTTAKNANVDTSIIITNAYKGALIDFTRMESHAYPVQVHVRNARRLLTNAHPAQAISICTKINVTLNAQLRLLPEFAPTSAKTVHIWMGECADPAMRIVKLAVPRHPAPAARALYSAIKEPALTDVLPTLSRLAQLALTAILRALAAQALPLLASGASPTFINTLKNAIEFVLTGSILISPR